MIGEISVICTVNVYGLVNGNIGDFHGGIFGACNAVAVDGLSSQNRKAIEFDDGFACMVSDNV